MQKVSIQFIKAKPPYNVNEVAGFSPSIAAAYVKGGVAVLVNSSGVETEILSKPSPESPVKSDFTDTLNKKVGDIEKSIIDTDDDGFFVFDNDALTAMLAEERAGKARKGVIKAIEDQLFKRLEDNG